jgi:hypothetical protein
MNRTNSTNDTETNKLQNSNNNNSPILTRKRKISNNLNATDDNNNIKTEQDNTDTALSRKSPRIKSKRLSSDVNVLKTTPAAKNKNVTSTNTTPTTANNNNNNNTSTSEANQDDNNDSKLNGAQFLMAASLNVNTKISSIGNALNNSANSNISDESAETIIINSSEISSENSNVDLVKLSQNVDNLNRKLEEHTDLFKRLSNVVDRLSTKLDSTIKAYNLTGTSLNIPDKVIVSEQDKKSDVAHASTTVDQQVKEIKNKTEQLIDRANLLEQTFQQQQQDESSPSSNRPIDMTTENDHNNQEDESGTIELINQKKLPSSAANLSPSPSSQSKLTKLKLDNLPLNDDIEAVVTSSLIELKNVYLNSEIASETPISTSTNTTTPTPTTANTTTHPTAINNEDNNATSLDTYNDNNNNKNTTNYTSDSSHEDEEEEDEEYTEANASKNSSRSTSNSNKNSSTSTSTTIAILNKTKIDTEFISNLIANKDPNDKRYDACEINKLRLLSHSYQNFAVKLLCRLFDEEEIIGRNVYGRNYSGDKTSMKQPLDPERINFIKETVLRLTKTNNPELAWASCVIAMNRKMVDINNKFLKSIAK